MTSPTASRTPFQGVVSIIRFNWPFFIFAALGFLVAAVLVSQTQGFLRLCGIAALAVSAGFFLTSLAVSWWIYDRSDLYRWLWLRPHLDTLPHPSAIICHTGFDEVSAALSRTFPGIDWRIVDHFDPLIMTEPSIRRARKHHPPSPQTLAAPFDRWNAGLSPAGLILGILSIHELRTEEQRILWFREALRHLRPGGTLILVEHLRDLPNLLAFGPGFLHFHSAAGWERCWKAAGFTLASRRRITPWLGCFTLRPS